MITTASFAANIEDTDDFFFGKLQLKDTVQTINKKDAKKNNPSQTNKKRKLNELTGP
jgi:hypothetical protein|tara:strand:+ start:588 stop:758 length:171 start_codon:yes stop_codon:yes gene_type:complete